MSNKNSLYDKSVLFTIVVAVVVLIGSVVTAFVPLAMDEMHPKLENLKPYTALELAGRNIYQKEGCFNCHSILVRPLKADVIRYGEYTKAGENYYERPFLWGSKRTGPDLARIGGKYSDEWHKAHFVNPQAFYPLSNMPKYTWLANNKVDVDGTIKGMNVLGFPYTEDDVENLKNSTELDALVAYMQVLGTAVPRKNFVAVNEAEYENAVNPFKDDTTSVEKGRVEFEATCANCHGVNGEGVETLTTALTDIITSDTTDGAIFIAIANGIDGVMPEHISTMTKDDIWNLVSYVRTLATKQGSN